MLNHAWNNRAKSMIPKIMIKSTGNASANSISACDGLLPDRKERDNSDVENLSFFISDPLMG